MTRSVMLDACAGCATCDHPRILAAVERVVVADRRRQQQRLADAHQRYLAAKYGIVRAR